MTWRSFAIALIAFGVTVSVSAAEKRLEKSQVPKAALAAVAAKYPKARMTGFSEEDEGGKRVYEVKLQWGGERAEVTVSSEGKILAEERVISMREVPDAVKKTLSTGSYAKAKVSRIERVTDGAKPDAPTYELQVEQGGRRHELVFAHTGELIEDEAK
jgi:uncharacterized membrane protein YkoI